MTLTLAAQEKKVGELYLSGKVVDENKRGKEATIYIFKNGIKLDEIYTNKIGKFQFQVALQDSVAFVVYADNYVSKTVFIDARVPQTKEKADYNFPFFIDLYPVRGVPSNIDLKRPVGKIIFSGTQFIYDIEFTKAQNERLKEFVRERKELRVRALEND